MDHLSSQSRLRLDTIAFTPSIIEIIKNEDSEDTVGKDKEIKSIQNSEYDWTKPKHKYEVK